MPEQVRETQETSIPEVEVAAPDTAPVAVKKVELDLDDAPFLQTEEQAPSPVDLDDNVPENADEADARRRKRKKLFIFGGIGAALLVACGIAAWWFFFRAAPPVTPTAQGPEVIVVPSTPGTSGPEDIVREFAPFVVPTQGTEGKTRFLVCKFSSISHDPVVNQEIQQQIVPLRDAIYYYLRSKDSAFLLDARNGPEIKKDLLSVFNDYLTQGKLEDIVFETYLGR